MIFKCWFWCEISCHSVTDFCLKPLFVTMDVSMSETWGWKFKNCLTRRTGLVSGVKVLCILHHRGIQLILVYSWTRPAILVAGKGRGGMYLFLLFLHFHSCSSFFPVLLFHLFYYLFYLFSPFLWETTRVDVLLNPTQSISQSINQSIDKKDVCDLADKFPLDPAESLPLSGLIQQMTNWWYFSYFSQKTGFDISCKLSPLSGHIQQMTNIFLCFARK